MSCGRLLGSPVSGFHTSSFSSPSLQKALPKLTLSLYLKSSPRSRSGDTVPGGAGVLPAWRAPSSNSGPQLQNRMVTPGQK